jgi:hypothetical protein
MTDRDEFEKWHDERFEFEKWHDERLAGDPDNCPHKEWEWEAWKAGRISRQKQDAELCRKMDKEIVCPEECAAKIEVTP